MARRVLFCVGEKSGDQHAANLVRELRGMDGEIIIDALGGAELRAAGAIIHHDSVSNAAVGIKALLRWREVLAMEKWMRGYLETSRPDLVICVDSWGMNKRFARLAHDRGVKVMYFISPQVWASREGRVKQMRRWVDRVACILPFEEEYLTSRGVAATYVGHPLFDHVKAAPRRAAAERYPNRPAVVAIVAGSRRGVASANFPRLLDVAVGMKSRVAGLTFRIPTTEATDPVVRSVLAKRRLGAGDGFVVDLDGFDRVMPEVDICLTVSGTATLHAAAFGVPMIAVYYVNPWEWHLIGRWIVKARTFVMVNILIGGKEKVVPEFIPWYGPVEPVTRAAMEMLKDVPRQEAISAKLAGLMARVGRGGASKRAAAVAMELMGVAEKREG
jgi:lipid-A-disaccharide synthase